GAREAGLSLSRLLWCRPKDLRAAIRAADALIASGAFPLVVLDLRREEPRPVAQSAWLRLARGAEANRGCLLVLGEAGAQSFAAGDAALRRAEMRVGCLFVPELPLQALLRAEPDLHGQPLAIFQGEGARARIQAVSVPARSQGVLPGMRIEEALALCPDLLLRADDEALREAAREAALDAAAAVSPRVEEAAPGLVLVDARGLGKLFGGDRGIASALLSAAR